MSEITRFMSWDGDEFMLEDPDGEYVLHDDHLAEVERYKTLIAALYYATVWELHRLPATLTPEKAREVMSIVRHVEQRPPITEGEEGTR